MTMSGSASRRRRAQVLSSPRPRLGVMAPVCPAFLTRRVERPTSVHVHAPLAPCGVHHWLLRAAVKVKADIELQPLASINRVLDRLAHGDVASRVVLESKTWTTRVTS